MTASPIPRQDFRNLPPSKKRMSVLVIGLSLAAGTGIAIAPQGVQNAGLTIIGAILTTAGTLQAALHVFIFWRNHQRWRGVIYCLLAIELLLLSRAAWSGLTGPAAG